MSKLFIALQYLLPQHLLSRWVGRLAASETPWLKNAFIQWFSRRYNIDMSLAAEPDLTRYASFNAFFTRALRAGVRPIDCGVDSVICPADGAVSQSGPISDGRILQAKNQSYSALELLGGDAELAAAFADGIFATIYLSPRDYHRVHMPISGTLRQAIYVPGDLFSVNQTTAEHVPRLFARNERLVCIFDTPAGPLAMVLVGAMIVAGIETVWAGQITPPRKPKVTPLAVADASITLKKGAEMGRFKLGSTVILLFGRNAVCWSETLVAGQPVQMGEAIGQQVGHSGL